MLEQPAGEDDDLEVGRLQPPPGHGTRPGLTVTNSKRPAVNRPGAPEAEEPVLERGLGSVVCRVGVAAGGVRLPDLDHAVLHGLAGAVEERPVDPDRPRVGRIDEPLGDQVAHQPDREDTGRPSATG